MEKSETGMIEEGPNTNVPIVVTQYDGPPGPVDRRRIRVLVGRVCVIDTDLHTWNAIGTVATRLYKSDLVGGDYDSDDLFVYDAHATGPCAGDHKGRCVCHGQRYDD